MTPKSKCIAATCEMAKAFDRLKSYSDFVYYSFRQTMRGLRSVTPSRVSLFLLITGLYTLITIYYMHSRVRKYNVSVVLSCILSQVTHHK